MLSKSKMKWINSLNLKKHRDEEGVFVAEGIKLVSDLLPFLKCRMLVATDVQFQDFSDKFTDEIGLISLEEYKKISFQKSPQGVLAVFEKPKHGFSIPEISRKLSLALDDIQDPGNLGTIIRLADWYGVTDVFCSTHSADVYSPKTVQATMGALARVRVHYVDLPSFLDEVKDEIPVYGTFMSGTNIYSAQLSEHGVIVIGNEGNGISAEVENRITHKITIPNYPFGSQTSESLNAGIATAITVSEFRRKHLK